MKGKVWITRYFVQSNGKRVGWNVRRIIRDNDGDEHDGGVYSEERNKKEARAVAYKLNAELARNERRRERAERSVTETGNPPAVVDNDERDAALIARELTKGGRSYSFNQVCREFGFDDLLVKN